MLIDDHPVVRAGLRAILDSFDDVAVVAEGSRGEEAIELAAQLAENTRPAAGINAGGEVSMSSRPGSAPGASSIPGGEAATASHWDGGSIDRSRPVSWPGPVDVVVMDLQMPGIGGVEATRRLRAAGGPPVLVLTTYDTQADILAAISAGALGYLLKDAPEDELHRAVIATARGDRTLSPEVATALAERVSAPFEALSAREIEILAALETGASNKQIAQQLFISLATVKTHLVHIYQKLGVDNRTAAISAARARKLI